MYYGMTDTGKFYTTKVMQSAQSFNVGFIYSNDELGDHRHLKKGEIRDSTEIIKCVSFLD